MYVYDYLPELIDYIDFNCIGYLTATSEWETSVYT